MIKYVNGYEISKKLENCKVHFRSILGSKVSCTKDHVKLLMREKSDHILLHIRTNGLNSNREPNLIVKSIVDLTIAIKSSSQNLIISNIKMRNVNLNNKSIEVNGH